MSESEARGSGGAIGAVVGAEPTTEVALPKFKNYAKIEIHIENGEREREYTVVVEAKER